MAIESKIDKSIPQYSKEFSDDEIDLFELCGQLYQQKILILAITLLFAFAGVGYSLVAPPVYKASAYLLPPLAQDVQALQVNLKNQPFFDKNINEIADEQGVKSIDRLKKEAVDSFLTHFQSRQLRRDFFDRAVLTEFSFDAEQQNLQTFFEKNFHEKLKLTIPAANNIGAPYTVTLDANDAELAAKWLNEYIDLTITQTKDQLIADIQTALNTKKAELNLMINSMREAALQKKNDRLDTLNEALVLAKAIGLQHIQEAQSPVPEVEYLRGSEAIQAEINILQQRELEDAFTPGLRELQRYLNYLNNIHIEPEDFNVVRVDQYAVSSDEPIKPKKALIIIISVILGAMLGAFIALIRSAFKARYENMSVN